MQEEKIHTYSSQEIQHMTENLLLDVGVPPHNKGYTYLVDAVCLSVENPEYLTLFTKLLYPEIAQKYGVKWQSVERCIRHSIINAFDRLCRETIEKYFGNTVPAAGGKLTNSEFIHCLWRIISRRCSEEPNRKAAAQTVALPCAVLDNIG